MEAFNEAWEVICSYCRKNITDVAYKTWISRIKPVTIDFDRSQAVLLVPNDFHKQTLERCYKTLLTEAFEAVFGTVIDIVFTVVIEEDKDEVEEIVDQGYEYTFDTFIIGNSNKFAHAACMAVAQNPSNAYNPLFLYGNSGLGKTHLLYAIANEIKKNDSTKKVCYVKCEDFTNEMVESIHMNRMDKFREKYRFVDVLLIDDIQFIGGKEATQEEFFHTFNALYENKKQIVVASDRPPKEIKSLVDRLRNRFEMDLIADIQTPDIETRIAIIKRKADLMNIEIPNEVCDYIATNIKSNIRQLEGIVKKIKAKNFIEGEKPSVKSVQSIISDIINNDTPPEVTVEKIIEEVARTFNVSEEEMRSPNNRSAYISKPRQVAIYIVSKMTTLTQDSIGKEFGGRDHSTIKYAIDTTKKNINKDSKLRSVVDDIIKNCSN
ncbi:MAG: chromosomal replication initiator protein DnaA [Oscillospiraceae bacterium]|nr:chromosomal replication initiator protein DnaA [Oscillospiraceae bacterium]